MTNSICAGIVLYNPDVNRLQENIEAIVNQVQIVYLQDNGSSNILEVEELLKKWDNVILLINPKNKGIAWALNRLCEKAAFDGFQWILTLDQDSVCPTKMISKYTKYLDKVDMLCPKIVDRNCGLLEGKSVNVENVKECITSGCLLKIESWIQINGFDEKMFIDGVDFEFCHRMTQNQMKILRINEVILNHELGNITIRHFLWFKVVVKNHSAFRKYYIARNIIYMARKRKSLFWIIKGMLQEIKLMVIILLYEENKEEKIKRIVKGITDGFKENGRVSNNDCI